MVGVILTAIATALVYRNAEQDARTEIKRELEVAADRMEILLGGLELTAQIVAAEVRRTGDLSDLSTAFEIIRASFPDFRTVITIDPMGIVRADMRRDAPAVGLNVSDRGYFQVQLDAASSAQHIAEPVVSRVDGRLTFPVSAPIRDAFGRLVGVVVSSVDAGYFQAAHDARDDWGGPEVFLLNPGQGVVVAFGAAEIPKPRLTEIERLYDRLVGADALPTESAVWDETRSVLAASALPTRDLALVKAVSRASVQAAAWKAAAGPALVVLLLTLVATAMVQTSARQAQRARDRAETMDVLRERLTLAAEAGRIGIWEYEPATNRLVWNERMFEIYGLPATSEPISYETWERRVHPNDLQETLGSLQGGVAGTGVYDAQFRIIRPDGGVRHVKARAARIPAGGAGETRLIGVNQDVTRQVEAERSLKRAVQEAVEANAAKSNFLASMSHNLRTPLNAVLGYGELLALDPNHQLTDRETGYARNIVQAGRDLLDLVNDILDLMLLEADRVTVHPERVDVAALAGDCVAQILPICEPRRIAVEDRASDAEPVLLDTDRRRFKQILLNLLSNAVRYNIDGGRITVSLDRTADGFVRIAVEDTGVGIPEPDRERVFDMFERLQADPQIAKEGVGIGLTISKLLAERLGGRIGFSSTVGVGSLFWVDLPPDGPPAAKASGLSAAAEPAGAGAPTDAA
ncbi:MAG: ATP-binding protein [Alphaproteobacteria bacterium]|nr:ATP-binding protein [Alphaproteobacteria bacterium]